MPLLLLVLTNGSHATSRQVCLRHTTTTPVRRKNSLFRRQTTISVRTAQFTDRVSNYSVRFDSKRPQNVNQCNLANAEKD